MVIWPAGKGEGGVWIRSRGQQFSAKTGHVGVIKAIPRAR